MQSCVPGDSAGRERPIERPLFSVLKDTLNFLQREVEKNCIGLKNHFSNLKQQAYCSHLCRKRYRFEVVF